MKNLKLLPVLIFLLGAFYACVSPKQIVSFQDKPVLDQFAVSAISDSHYIALIQPGDMLNIYVSSASPEASKYFNFSEREDQNSMANIYLVDEKGLVRIPLIGDLHVSGMTSSAARDSLTKRLEKYLLNPAVKLTIRNFRVTVLGEIAHPGVVTVMNERITLPEALAMAGDMTVYSSRDNVLVVRDDGKKKVYATVDLTSREVFSSPYYYLHANDIVYVEPMKTKRAMAENWYRILPIIFSGVTLMLAVIAVVK